MRRFTSHGPSIGRFVEVLLLDILRKHFPRSLEFTSGFIQSTNPEATVSSPQLDIICYDRSRFPVLFDIGEIKVLLPMSVRAIIEVKSTLDSNSIRKFLRLAESPGLAEVPVDARLYLVSTKSAMSPEACFRRMDEYYKSKPPVTKLLAGIFCLDWDEFIMFTRTLDDTKIKYGMERLKSYEVGIGEFLSFLLSELHGREVAFSAANTLPSLFKHLESREYTLYLGPAKPAL